MIKKYIFVLFTLLILSSCGKSKEEIELEKAKIELEKTKLELAEKTKKEEENKANEQKAELNKIHEQKVNVGKRKKITELNLMLQKLPQAIEDAEQNIRKINEFQIGRSSSTKEKQLQEATTQLREIRDYGENDSDVNQICYAEMMMKNQQDNLKAEFENGRVIGKALINGDKAEVEFAFGPSANRLEKMGMVKRNGLWYLSGF